MDTERQTLAGLAVRGREVVASYLPGVDVAWADDEEDVVEILNGAGKLRRIRVSVTGGENWLLPRSALDEEPEVEAGWWAFVRMREESQPEVYLATEDQVRDLMTRLVEQTAPVPAGTVDDGADELADVMAEPLPDDAVRVGDAEVRPLLRSWRELTADF